MSENIRFKVSVAVAVAALAAGLAVAMGPVAQAATPRAPHPPSMDLHATGGDGTTVDSDGTQGSFTNSVQGTVDSDGDQDAHNLIRTEEAVPQDTAPNKMTK